MTKSNNRALRLLSLLLAFLVHPLCFADGLSELWRIGVGDEVLSLADAGSNGVIAATDGGNLVAIGPGGEKRWQVRLGGKSVELTCDERFAYAVSRKGQVSALSLKDGSMLWRRDLDGYYQSPPLLIQMGETNAVAFMEQGGGALTALVREKGSLIWQSESTERCDGPPSLSSHGIVFGNCDAALYVVDPVRGVLSFNLPLGKDAQVAGGVAVAGEDAWVGTHVGELVAVSLKERRVRWRASLGEEAFVEPAVTRNVIIGGTSDGLLASVRRVDGKVLWRSQMADMPRGPVVVGKRIVVSVAGELQLLSLIDARTLWRRELADELTAPLVKGDRVVVGGDDGYVWCFAGGDDRG